MGTIKLALRLILRVLDLVTGIIRRKKRQEAQNEAQKEYDKAADDPSGAMVDKFGGVSVDEAARVSGDAAEAGDSEDRKHDKAE